MKLRCANGLPGADIVTGKSYAVKHPCANAASHGSIYCPSCRKESGGFVRFVYTPKRGPQAA